jgi:hypothetical protein
VRLERFDNKNADGVSFVKSDDLWAPRVGFSWDVNGDSSFKVFGNAGRYFIPVANNTSIRASGAEATTNQYFLYTAVDPTTGAPTKSTELGTLQLNGGLNAPNPATVAAANLSPMYQDEYILGMQKQLTDNLTIGIRGIRRSIKDGFDDTCAHPAADRLGHGQRLHELRLLDRCPVLPDQPGPRRRAGARPAERRQLHGRQHPVHVLRPAAVPS